MKLNTLRFTKQLGIALALLLSVGLSACSNNDDDSTPAIVNTDDPTESSPDTAEPMDDEPAAGEIDNLAKLQGLWEWVGYGDIVRVGENGAKIFQYTRMGCLVADSVDIEEVIEFFGEPKFSEDGMRVTPESESQAAFPQSYERRDALPVVCEPDNLIDSETPTATFEHIWHNFNDYYAFFNERGVNWDEQYAALSPRVSDDMSDEALLDVITDLLQPLNDFHVALATDDDGFDFVEPNGVELAIEKGFENQSEFDDIDNYIDDVLSRYYAVINSYLDEDATQQDGGTDQDQFTWATINQQVGYLRISEMSDLVTSEDEEGLLTAEIAAVNRIMPQVLQDLQDTSALIIDVRLNGGGNDSVSLAIASYFTDETRLAVAKRARSYSGETAEVTASISPATDNPYLKPIAILSSTLTGSAAEIFLMTMNALPQVTLVGENSAGGLSDVLVKTLANGWEFGLSNEVYTDSMGIGYEVTGVPADVPASTVSLDAISNGVDPSIDAAIATLGF